MAVDNFVVSLFQSPDSSPGSSPGFDFSLSPRFEGLLFFDLWIPESGFRNPVLNENRSNNPPNTPPCLTTLSRCHH